MSRTRDRITVLLDKSMSTRISPLAYLFTCTGLVRGVAFTFFQTAGGVASAPSSKTGEVMPLTIWGSVILVSSIVLLVGMYLKNAPTIMTGAAGMACTWGITAFAALNAHYFEYLLPVAILNILMYGYFFIAAPIGRLWDYAPVPYRYR